jgi:hypothetical protein
MDTFIVSIKYGGIATNSTDYTRFTTLQKTGRQGSSIFACWKGVQQKIIITHKSAIGNSNNNTAAKILQLLKKSVLAVLYNVKAVSRNNKTDCCHSSYAAETYIVYMCEDPCANCLCRKYNILLAAKIPGIIVAVYPVNEQSEYVSLYNFLAPASSSFLCLKFKYSMARFFD